MWQNQKGNSLGGDHDCFPGVRLGRGLDPSLPGSCATRSILNYSSAGADQLWLYRCEADESEDEIGLDMRGEASSPKGIKLFGGKVASGGW